MPARRLARLGLAVASALLLSCATPGGSESADARLLTDAEVDELVCLPTETGAAVLALDSYFAGEQGDPWWRIW